MDFKKDIEEIAGAVAAVEGIKKLDPKAGLITEGAAAIAGFEGGGAIGQRVEEALEHKKDDQPES